MKPVLRLYQKREEKWRSGCLSGGHVRRPVRASTCVLRDESYRKVDRRGHAAHRERGRTEQGGLHTSPRPKRHLSIREGNEWRSDVDIWCDSASYHRRKTTEKREGPRSNPIHRLLFQMTPSACPARVISMYEGKESQKNG